MNDANEAVLLERARELRIVVRESIEMRHQLARERRSIIEHVTGVVGELRASVEATRRLAHGPLRVPGLEPRMGHDVPL